MDYLIKLGAALITAAITLAAHAEAVPDESAAVAAAELKPVVVTLKDDMEYEVFADQVTQDSRTQDAAQAWQYLDRGVLGVVQALELAHRFQAKHVYSHTIKGFSARLTPAQVEALKSDPAVRGVDEVGPVSVNAQSLTWNIRQIGGHLSSTRSGDGTGAVRGVHVFVIDTGIDPTARDLTLVGHANFAGDGLNRDCNGHGTHVAGIIGAMDNDVDVVGVAPGVPLIGVKVVGCGGFGFLDDVIKGVDWVTAVALKPSIVNVSVGGGAYRRLDEAIQRSAEKGLFYAVSAGNAGGNACDHSPARAGFGFFNGVVTVGATDLNDREAPFSNSGECVDLWAPGVSILSTYLRGTLNTLSGTSMASAHVSGTAALLLSRAPGLLPGSMELALKSVSIFPGTFSRDGRPIARVNAQPF